MQLAGPYAFGPPPDPASAIGVLRAAVAAGVDHIDTAQYYGPGVVNELIREALPLPRRAGDRQQVASAGTTAVPSARSTIRTSYGKVSRTNLRSLRVGQPAAVNLRLPVTAACAYASMTNCRDGGGPRRSLIAEVGLSNVSLEQLRRRGGDRHCLRAEPVPGRQAAGPPFLRSASAAASRSCRSARSAGRAARTTPCSPAPWSFGQPPASASPGAGRTRWLLQLAPNVLLIPGTGSIAHLGEPGRRRSDAR
jgi:hypothetical protein